MTGGPWRLISATRVRYFIRDAEARRTFVHDEGLREDEFDRLAALAIC